MYSGTPAPVSIKMGARRPTRYVLVPGPVIMPGLRPSTRPTRSLGVAVFGKSGSIQGIASSLRIRRGTAVWPSAWNPGDRVDLDVDAGARRRRLHRRARRLHALEVLLEDLVE